MPRFSPVGEWMNGKIKDQGSVTASGEMMECVLVDPYHLINFTKKIPFSFKSMLEILCHLSGEVYTQPDF